MVKMLNRNESYNWTREDYYNAIRTEKAEHKSSVNLDTEHCTAANEKQLVRWANEDGCRAEINPRSKCVKIYFES